MVPLWNLCGALGLLVVRNESLDMIIVSYTSKFMQENLDYGLQQVPVTVWKKEVLLSVLSESLVVEELRADSEYFNSQEDSGSEKLVALFSSELAGSDGRSNTELELVLAILNKDPYGTKLSKCSDGANSTGKDKEAERFSVLAIKVEHLDERNNRELPKEPRDTDTLACEIQDLEPANFPIVHRFGLMDDTMIHSNASPMSPEHKAAVKR